MTINQPDFSPASREETPPYTSGLPTTPTTSLKRVRVPHLQQMKERGEKFTVLTSYDTFTAQIFDEVGIDVLLIGDSASSTVYGHKNSLPVTVEELLPLAGAVARSAQRALVIADLPFGSYENSPEQAFTTAARFVKDAGVAAVKMEGGVELAPTIEHLVRRGIPVCAHIGFTPQREHSLGGYRIQGRGNDAAAQVLADAHAAQNAGAFAVLLEMVPADVAAQISAELAIPTIGIGAGKDTDAQVLVWQDAFGLNTGRFPRFVKQYADLQGVLREAAKAYDADVRSGRFPTQEHSF